MFNVKIKTNAVMIHEEEAQRLRELGVDTIQISVYSHRPEVHDAITKLPHSFERTIRCHSVFARPGVASHHRQRSDDGEFCRSSVACKNSPPNWACITRSIPLSRP